MLRWQPLQFYTVSTQSRRPLIPHAVDLVERIPFPDVGPQLRPQAVPKAANLHEFAHAAGITLRKLLVRANVNNVIVLLLFLRSSSSSSS